MTKRMENGKQKKNLEDMVAKYFPGRENLLGIDAGDRNEAGCVAV
jgi:hypothetical protein